MRAVDDVEALVIPGSAFRAFLERRPRVALVLLRSVAARLREADRQRVDYAINDVVVRVASRLVDLCDRYGAEDEAGIDIGLAITQDELAAWAGASREAVAKAMALLRTLGLGQDRAAADHRAGPRRAAPLRALTPRRPGRAEVHARRVADGGVTPLGRP